MTARRSLLVRVFAPAAAMIALGLAGAWWISRDDGLLPPKPPPAKPADPFVVPVPEEAATAATLPPFAVVFGGELAGRFWVPPCSTARTGGALRLQRGILDAIAGVEAALVLGTGDTCASPGAVGAVEW